MKEDIFFKIVGAVIVLIVGTVGAVTLERMGDIQTSIGEMGVSVSRIVELDEITERLNTLEDVDSVIPHAQLSSSKSNFSRGLISFELEDSVAGVGFDHRRDPTTITIKEGGSYLVIIAPQVRRKVDFNHPACVSFWLRVNDTDLQNSSIEKCWVRSDWSDTTVIVLQAILSLEKGDTIQASMQSVPIGRSGIVAIEHAGIPLVPAVILSIIKVG